jgi:hypothetical protein
MVILVIGITYAHGEDGVDSRQTYEKNTEKHRWGKGEWLQKTESRSSVSNQFHTNEENNYSSREQEDGVKNNFSDSRANGSRDDYSESFDKESETQTGAPAKGRLTEADSPGEIGTSSDTINDEINENEKESNRVGNIEETEIDKLQKRKKSFRLFMAGFGPAGLANVDSKDLLYSFFGGYLWEVNPNAAIKIKAELSSDFDEALLVAANLGGNLYLLRRNISPYVGAVLGLGFLGKEGSHDGVGFTFGGSVGVQLFRTSTTQMNVEFALQSHLGNYNDDGVPVLYTGRVGVLF